MAMAIAHLFVRLSFCTQLTFLVFFQLSNNYFYGIFLELYNLSINILVNTHYNLCNCKIKFHYQL